MARSLFPVVKASLISPLVVVPISLLIAIPLVIFTGNLKEARAFVFFYIAFGLPVAYASLLVVGLPGYLLARWLRMVSYPAALITAAVACMIASCPLGDGTLNVFASLILFAFGAPIATVFVWIVRRESPIAYLRTLLD